MVTTTASCGPRTNREPELGPRVTTRTAPPGATPWRRSLGSSRKGSDDPSPGNNTTAGVADVWCSGASGSMAVSRRSRGAPQEEQKLAPTGLRCPQRLQYNASGLEELSVVGGAQQRLDGSGGGGLDHA